MQTMPPKSAAVTGSGKPKRKRQRKTRTLAVSSDESSSSSSSSEEDSDGASARPKATSRNRSPTPLSSSSSSSSSSHSGEEDSDVGVQAAPVIPTRAPASKRRSNAGIKVTPPPSSSSDSDGQSDSLETIARPPVPSLPKHLETAVRRKTHPGSASNARQAELAARQERKVRANAKKSEEREKRKEAFRSLWLKTVAEEFGDELDAIRTKEPTLGADGGTRLPLFIDALTAGSEVYSSAAAKVDRTNTTDEVSLAMNLG